MSFPGSDTTPQKRSVLLVLGWYYPEIHRGVAQYARDHHWHITFDFEEPLLDQWTGDGVITLLGVRDELWAALQRFPGPVVDLSESRPEIALPRVTMNNHEIGSLAAEYYLGRGYRHFLFLHRWNLGVSTRRKEGFQQQLTRAGYSCETLCWQTGRGNFPDSRDQRLIWLGQHLQKLPKPLAVFGTRDIEAAEVIEACALYQLQVPEQVAVLGVDNAEMICECLRVPMSSIDNNLEQVGYAGATLLDQLMDGEPPPVSPVYISPVGVVERRSTDHLAVAHPDVAAALRIIHEEYQKPLTMREILERVPISRSGLEKAFREHYVRPPMEELRKVRFAKAQKMLAETGEKIAAIANKCGFETSHNLCRSFKQRFQMTPKQYREKFRTP